MFFFACDHTLWLDCVNCHTPGSSWAKLGVVHPTFSDHKIAEGELHMQLWTSVVQPYTLEPSELQTMIQYKNYVMYLKWIVSCQFENKIMPL